MEYSQAERIKNRKEIVSLKNHTNCKGKCTANSSVCRMNQQLDENKCE